VKKYLLFSLVITSSCFANVIDYNSTTGTYRLDQYGHSVNTKGSNSIDSSFYTPTQKDLSGDSENSPNYMKQSLRRIER
jgi:hypothetical protein